MKQAILLAPMKRMQELSMGINIEALLTEELHH